MSSVCIMNKVISFQADTSCSDSDLDRCVGPKHWKDIQVCYYRINSFFSSYIPAIKFDSVLSLIFQRENLVAGSTALLNNSPMEAVEKFKAVLEKIGTKPNQV